MNSPGASHEATPTAGAGAGTAGAAAEAGGTIGAAGAVGTTGKAGAATKAEAGGNALYRGLVMHRRTEPLNEFRYGVYYLYLDIDRIDELEGRLRLFSHNRFNLTALYDEDHGPRNGTPLRPWIDGWLRRAGLDLEGGPVRLLTFPRVLGFRFYPISLWYCFHKDGSLRAILAEVNNTYGDRHSYLLHEDGRPLAPRELLTAEKVMHVSPFIDMEARYEFRFVGPGSKLGVHIDDIVRGEKLLVATLNLRREELSDAALLRTVLSLGPMSLRAWTLIRRQALRLLRLGVSFRRRPQPPHEEVSL